jgi:hypothetical protein
MFNLSFPSLFPFFLYIRIPSYPLLPKPITKRSSSTAKEYNNPDCTRVCRNQVQSPREWFLFDKTLLANLLTIGWTEDIKSLQQV